MKQRGKPAICQLKFAVLGVHRLTADEAADGSFKAGVTHRNLELLMVLKVSNVHATAPALRFFRVERLAGEAAAHHVTYSVKSGATLTTAQSIWL